LGEEKKGRKMKSEKMVKLWKALIFAVIFVMLAHISVGIGIASMATIYVPDDYAKIQWTVDNASAVDTINVMGGTNENEENASLHLYEQMDKYKSGTKLRLIESYVGTVTHPTTYTAWVYDNDLAILALADRGTAEDKERAEILCDALVWCQNHDQDFSDGRVRDGYWATDIKDPSGKISSIKSPGSGTGNMAWTIIALLRYYEVSKNETYLEAAKRLGNWIFKECYNDSGAGGYTGGYEDQNFDWELEKITWKSTEHNIDTYVAFLKLYNVTGNTTWLDRAIHANKFVKAMWNESEGHFWTGTLNDGVTLNEGLLPEDVNTWGLMALGNPNKYGRGIRWVENNCKVDSRDCGCDGVRFEGFDCDDDKDGIWFEGTAHMCIAYQIMNETDNSSKYISELRRAQTCANNSNGKGIVAACHDGVTCCHWEFPNALHIGATSWYIFAERKLNPFLGINTSDRITIMWYVDDDGGADFTSIQDTVDAANDGDIIIVNSGTYYENVNVTKQLILMGVDTGSGKPVVDAGGNGSAITLSADGITLDGFTATNSGSGLDAGIKVTSNNNIITGNAACNNSRYGIDIMDSSNNTITGNTASNNRLHGVYLRDSSNNNTITGNTVSNNSQYGIRLRDSSNNNITGNTVSNNDHPGIDLYISSSNTITGNTFENDGLFVSFSYQSTVENNIVNGKPLVYLEDVSDYKVEEAGQVILVNCNNITVENLNLSNTCVGVELWQTEDSLISNNTASNNSRYGIYLPYSSNNNITGNTVDNNDGFYLEVSSNLITSNYYYGISLDYSSNNNITGNTVSNNHNGIRLGDSSNNNIITGNTVSNNHNGIRLGGSSNNIITGNTFVNDGFFVSHSYQNTVENNIVNGKPLVYLENTSDVEVTDAGQVILVNCNNITVETLNLSNTSVGLELWETEDSLISNNTASNNNDGIYLWDSSNNIITGNDASNNNDGIYLWDSSNNNITGNTVRNNDYPGIEVYHSSNNTLMNNAADSNNYGIRLFRSSNNTLMNNTANSNKQHGIWLDSSSNDNIITGNNACNNNYYGIYPVTYSNNNKIYLNNFINNSKNVYSYNSTNIWNSTKEITYTYGGSTRTNYMGNYWDDYTDVDSESDGLWDTPYSIDPDNDCHPLVEPFENYFAPTENIFDTGPGTYPSISGTHNGTIKPTNNILIHTLYTYSCHGTGGHTEYVRIWNETLDVNATWDGYKEDWHNISFNEPFTLVAGETYNYTIRTGSYPQIHHKGALPTANGWINCTEFIDANGKIYYDWIPAIRLWTGQKVSGK